MPEIQDIEVVEVEEAAALPELTIPLVPDADDSFPVDLEGQTIRIRKRWNSLDAGWYMDIEGITFNLSLLGIKMVCGVNFFKPHAVTELGGLFMLDVEDKNRDPDFDGLGTSFILYYVPRATMEAEFNEFI